MAEGGTIITRAFTSEAQLPVENVTVAVLRRNPDGTRELLALRTSDSSGRTAPVDVAVADGAAPQPGSPAQPPRTLVELVAEAEGFEKITVENVQVFSGVTTDQSFALIPLAQFPELWNRQETFRLPQQNL